jgi:hypothetical protein
VPPHSETVNRPRDRQALEQSPPVVNLLATRDFKRGQARFLKALIGVGPIAQQTESGLPCRRPVPTQYLFPVWHERFPPSSLTSTLKSFLSSDFLHRSLSLSQTVR